MNFGIAVKAFIVRDGRLLLIQRGQDRPHKPGVWDIPGGRLDQGEDISAGLRREAKEESGLDVRILAPIDLHHFVRDDGQQIAMLIFLCAADSGEVRLSHEHQNYQWHDLSAAQGMPDWLQPVLEKYREFKMEQIHAD